MRVDGPGATLSFDNMSDRPILGSSGWTQASVVLDVPANAIGIALGVLLAGAGDLVVDDFRLETVGPEIPSTSLYSVPQPNNIDSATTVANYARQSTTVVDLDFEGIANLAIPSATISWLGRTAVPFATVVPGSNETDLTPLKQMIGNASLVAMGEGTHGTREFFQMKHRVFQYLVHQMGFTHFAIEATWPESNDMNTYVLTGKGNPNALLSNLYFWTWRTQEVLDLVKWMREWNVSAPASQRVQFVGFDMQFPGAAMDTVAAFVARVDSANTAFVSQKYACLVPYRNRGATFRPVHLELCRVAVDHARRVCRRCETGVRPLRHQERDLSIRHLGRAILECSTQRAGGGAVGGHDWSRLVRHASPRQVHGREH
jgi:hypothetical protein